MKFTIHKLLNDDCTDLRGNKVPHFAYESNRFKHAKSDIVGDASSATLEELVKLCDQDAEDCNSHPFVGVHRILGAVLFLQYGRHEATKTMLFVAERKGLHTMSGDQVPDKETAYKELGVGLAGHDWNGSYD